MPIESPEEIYLMVRDTWGPGLTPKQINEGFTLEQIHLLNAAEGRWAEKKKEFAREFQDQGECENVGEDEMFGFLRGIN